MDIRKQIYSLGISSKRIDVKRESTLCNKRDNAGSNLNKRVWPQDNTIVLVKARVMG